MKLIQILSLFLVCASVNAGSIITATITVTNAPADGNTITVNGDTRTWKTSVATPSTQITIGSDAGNSATNAYSQFLSTRFTTLAVEFSGTNAVKLRGIPDQAMSASLVGAWGVITYTTNTTASGNAVLVPGSSYSTQSTATNLQSLLALDLGTYSTNKLANGTKLLEGVVQTNGTQTINGVKTFAGANVYSNTAQSFVGGTITGASLYGITNAYVSNLFAYGPLYLSNSAPALWFHDNDSPADEKNIQFEMANGDLYLIAWDDALGSYSYFARFERTGSTVDGVSFPNGEVQIGGGGGANDRLRVTGSTLFNKVDITTLATGNNAAIDFENRTFCKISSGPAGAFSLNGIAGGADGKMIVIYNATGQTMTIVHDSGVDPTPANRIYTTGAGTVTCNVATVIYDSTASRWILVSSR